MAINPRIKFISNLLVKKGFLTKKKCEDFFHNCQENPPQTQQDLDLRLIQDAGISEKDLLTAYGQHMNIPFLDLASLKIDSEFISLIPAKFANKNKVIAVKKEGKKLTVALSNPFDINMLDELKVLTKLKIQPVLSFREDIDKAIKEYYGVGAETVATIVQDAKSEEVLDGSGDYEKRTQEKSGEAELVDNSMIQYVNQIVMEAYQKQATDIHIEPFEHVLRIRYRIDGVLYEIKTPSELKQLHNSIISRLKIMANLNIAEKRKPQDGRCKIILQGEEVDMRIATFPTLYGEGMSIRLLSKSLILLGVDQLGLAKKEFAQLKTILKKPNGMLLVTGPTGCGKTTTLYACLNFLNDSKVNIITLEDPVEYQLEGINQIQINPQVDLVFSSGLRSILRQDPDIVMVGEIRDLETAQISVRAALTGHLIFSTLHTNNAVATIARLMDMGIDSYLVNGTVRGVIAQRLVRKVCNKCKQKYTPDNEILKIMGLTKKQQFVRGKGCQKCNNTGYRGRTGIYELLIIDERLGALISSNVTEAELRKQACNNGMKTLKEDGLEKAKNGITTLEEVIRVTEQE
ncbi:MAG: GspE/PulE family protein [Candidatus Omnitrophota bacterium]